MVTLMWTQETWQISTSRPNREQFSCLIYLNAHQFLGWKCLLWDSFSILMSCPSNFYDVQQHWREILNFLTNIWSQITRYSSCKAVYKWAQHAHLFTFTVPNFTLQFFPRNQLLLHQSSPIMEDTNLS